MLIFATTFFLTLKLAKKSLVIALKAKVFESLLKRDYKFWVNYKSNEITQFLSNEMVYYEKGVTEALGLTLMMTSNGLLGCFIAFFYSWRLSLIILATFFGFGMFIMIYAVAIGGANERKTECIKKSGGILEETF